MKNNILSLSKNLISIRSISGDVKALGETLDMALSYVSEYTIERFEKNGFKSALVYSSKQRPKNFKILLNAHLDILSGKKYQYIPRVVGKKLYGVGAMDMKASAACLIMVFKEMSKRVNYPLGLQLVTDEEPGGFNGTKYQIEKGVRADFVIAGESTNLNIVNRTKGVIWIKISNKGRAAHGAYPWRGKNAIWEMNHFLKTLEKQYAIPKSEKWTTTVNLSKIQTSNETFNKIPDDCEVWLDIRYTPKEKYTVINTIKKLLPKGFSINIIENEPALETKANNQYIKRLQKITKQITKKSVSLYGAQGTSDARHFGVVNCDGIEFGPIGGGIGSDNEWVDISSLKQYTQILKEFLLSFDYK